MKESEQAPFPKVTKTLVKALNDAFPMKDFNPDTSLRELDYHYGQRSVVNFLKLKLEEQSENLLNNF
jgi:hypothetical protein|tara:strand:+ start:751 stop:951 length:201 start_codon:yes stop_codon:yes gene_type:complete